MTGMLAAGLILAAGARAAETPSYTVAATTAERTALLAADDAAWGGSSPIAWGPAPYETRFRALWSSTGLYLRFDVDDASPWHTMTKKDEHLWDEEVVEIFIDLDRSGRDYYELEVNPANVVCDLRMISPWPDKKGDIDWDMAGLETRVHERQATGSPRGWTATAFLPWSGFRSLPSARVALPPKPGDAWRFNVFRIERPGGPKSPEKDAVFAAWSPPSAQSFHDAGALRDLVFGGAAR
ncbi:MAG TPA: carbohydrate-binding family 9-like protein [Vicinamibacteria bacterium]|nr:carbohydrate-binding family 9-like protein [Vicinamibacteria bacterium]